MRPTLFLTVGLPGTGKTTEARRLEADEKALRLTTDEWVKALFGLDNPESAADRGARVVICYTDVTPAEQRRRLDRRQAEQPDTTWPVTEEDLATWARVVNPPTPGEVDGTEPVGAPPAE